MEPVRPKLGSYCHSVALRFLGMLPEVDTGLRFKLGGLLDLLIMGFLVDGKSVSKSLWLIIYGELFSGRMAGGL